MLALRPTFQVNSRGIGLTATVLLHAALLGVLLSHPPLRTAIRSAAPIIVSLISTPQEAKPIKPPKPLPMRTTERAVQPRVEPIPQPMLSVPTPSTFETIAPDIAKTAPQAPPAPSVPLPIVPPEFNAAYLDNPAPTYPPLARRTGEQGRVVLRVLVTATGSADAVELKTGSGSSRLDQAAIETVKRWRFAPARQGDHTVAAWVLVPITFSLER